MKGMRILTLTFLSLFASAAAWADGTVAGRVTDGKTGEPLIGVAVVVKGSATGAVTDVDGNYNLVVPAGAYEIEIRYLGYNSKSIADVVVKDGEVTPLKVALAEAGKSTQLNEVVVRSSLKKENIGALYTLQKNAAAISDGISADVIRRAPDRSTGEVLKRVSGTTIQDNRFVIVRGLSDRYNTALVDNSILPSTEPNRKAFSFDIIPAALIDNITITKAATPDLPGDFAGGLINISTKEIPEQNFAAISVGSSVNTVSTGKSFQSGYRTGTDILGFDNGSRQLPKGLPSSASLQAASLSGPQSIPYINTLNNDFGIRTHSALPGMAFQGALGRLYRFKNTSRLGLTAAVTYGHSETIRQNVKREYDNYNYTDNIYQYNSNLGALFNVGYAAKRSKIVFKSLYNRIFDDNFLTREGVNLGGPRDVRYYAYDLVQKSLLKTSVEGDHQIGSGQAKFNWVASYNVVTNNQPDQRKVNYSRASGTNDDFSADNTSLGKANSRLFGNLYENIGNLNLNYTQPLKMFTKTTLKVGAFGQYRHRNFDNRYIGLILNTNVPTESDPRTRPVQTLFAQDVIDAGVYRLEDGTLPGDRYNADATTAAGYAMLDNKIGEKVRLVYGVRYEDYQLNLTSGDGNKVSRSWGNLLPSFNATYALTEKSNLRASYFRSIARPELREVAGSLSYYDYELQAIVTGNYNLDISRIDNMDLRYEYYPAPGEIFSVSAFYKSFDKTLENQVLGFGSAYEISTINYPSARNVGVELELRKNLGFLATSSSFMRNLSFYANLAYINSRVKVEGASRQVGTGTIDYRPLAGQSPYMINASLGYNALEGKLGFNILYNRIGQRIVLVGQDRFGQVYEAPRNMLDFQASWNISKRSELRLNVRDILNNKVLFYFDNNNNGKFDGSAFYDGTVHNTGDRVDWIQQEYRPGSIYALSYLIKL